MCKKSNIVVVAMVMVTSVSWATVVPIDADSVVAGDPNSNPHFQGKLDDIRVYSGVLTWSQLQAAISGE